VIFIQLYRLANMRSYEFSEPIVAILSSKKISCDVVKKRHKNFKLFTLIKILSGYSP